MKLSPFPLYLLFTPLLLGETSESTRGAMRVMRDECLGCHKPGKAKGGLLLHTYEKMMSGGDSGGVVTPGNPEDSLLYQVLQIQGDPHMPPKKQLTEEQISAFKEWIQSGAGWDATIFDEAPTPRQVLISALPVNSAQVLAVALSPDEKMLAVARANRLQLLDLTAAGRPVIGEMTGHVEPIQSIAWSPNGRSLVTGGFQRIIVWDVASRQAAHTLQAPLLGNITALVIDVSGTTLYVADSATGGAGFLHEFDMGTGGHRATWKGHDDTIYGLTRSAVAGRILTGSADKMVKLWDTSTRKPVATFEGHTNHVLSVAFNKDGSQIASTGADREVKLWDVKTGEQLISLGDKRTCFTSLAWSADGQVLVAATDKGSGFTYRDFKAHDGAQSSSGTKELGLTPVKGMLTSICITADGKSIYAGGMEGTIHKWDGATCKISE